MAHLVITIGCEYGAKGNQIGRRVAEDLGIKFYDRETVDEIIKEVGIPKDIMEKVEQGVTIAGKGAINNRMSNLLMRMLEQKAKIEVYNSRVLESAGI